jgi:hypothetical protein
MTLAALYYDERKHGNIYFCTFHLLPLMPKEWYSPSKIIAPIYLVFFQCSPILTSLLPEFQKNSAMVLSDPRF